MTLKANPVNSGLFFALINRLMHSMRANRWPRLAAAFGGRTTFGYRLPDPRGQFRLAPQGVHFWPHTQLRLPLYPCGIAEEANPSEASRVSSAVEQGAKLAGALVGGTVGTLAGPAGSIGGAVAGVVATESLLRLGREVMERVGQRAAIRTGAAMAIIVPMRATAKSEGRLRGRLAFSMLRARCAQTPRNYSKVFS